MRKLFLSIVAFLFFGNTIWGQAQYIWNDKTQYIYDEVTSLKIPEARKLIAIEKKGNPNNLIFTLLESYADFYELFLNEDLATYKRFEPQFENRIKQLEAGPKNSPYYLYSLGVLHYHKSLSALRFDKIWNAAFDFRKAYLLFKENRKSYPQFTPNDVYFGAISSMVGTIPKGYQWIANILGLSGKISEGNALVLKYINSNDEYSKRCRNEALFVYPYLVMNFEGNPKKAFAFDYD